MAMPQGPRAKSDPDLLPTAYERATLLMLGLEGLASRAQHASVDAQELRDCINPLWEAAVELHADLRDLRDTVRSVA